MIIWCESDDGDKDEVDDDELVTGDDDDAGRTTEYTKYSISGTLYAFVSFQVSADTETAKFNKKN